MLSAAPFSAGSLPKLLTMPVASSSTMPAFLPRSPEIADALALAENQADQAGRPEHDDEQQQNAENDRPDILIAVGQPEAHRLDHDGAYHRADQRAGAAEQHVKHHLRRHDDAEHIGPDEPLVESAKGAGQAGNRTAQREDDRLEMLHLVTEEGDALLVLPQPGERKPKLGTHQETAQQVDYQQDAQRQIVEPRSFVEFVAADRHRPD